MLQHTERENFKVKKIFKQYFFDFWCQNKFNLCTSSFEFMDLLKEEYPYQV